MDKRDDGVNFVSFSWKRFICGVMLFLVGLHDLFIFWPLSGRYVSTGSVMTFEGPSYFLSTGLVPLVVGIGLLVYSGLSYFKGKISQEGDKLKIVEKRIIKKVKTNIDKEKILSISLTNNEIGIKYLWLFLFIPYLIVNYYYMIVNFNQPFVVDFVNRTAVVILVSIIFSAIGLTILFCFPQWLLEIYTTEGKHELWFEPFKKGRDQIKKVAIALGIVEDAEKEAVRISSIKNVSVRNLILAVFFIGYGAFNIISFMTTFAIFQTIVTYILVIMGVYLLSKELRKVPMSLESTKDKPIKENSASIYYQRYFYWKNNNENSRETKYILNNFEVFWAICAGIIFIVVPFKIAQIWLVINDYNIDILLDNAIITTIFGAAIMGALTYYLLMPEKQIYMKSSKFTLKFPAFKSELRKKEEKKKVSAFKNIFKDRALKRQFIKRIVYISICIAFGIILLMWQYFFYFNLFNIFNF